MFDRRVPGLCPCVVLPADSLAASGDGFPPVPCDHGALAGAAVGPVRRDPESPHRPRYGYIPLGARPLWPSQIHQLAGRRQGRPWA